MNLRILIVDDIVHNNEILKSRLEKLNYDILTATTADDGIKLAKENSPDLILMDLALPGGMSGWEATEVLLKDDKTKNIPVIAVSATITHEDRDRIKHIGFSDYCIKPIKVKQLVSLIKSWIEVDDSDFDKMEPLTL